MPELDADFEISTNNLEAEYEISEGEHFDCSFEIFASGTSWGSITGNIENQTDLKEALDDKANVSAVEIIAEDVNTITNTLDSFGDIVTYDAADFATKNQGELADTALQPNDDISKLVNDVGYITDSALSDYATKTELTNGLAEKQDTISDLSTIRSNAENGQSAYSTIQNYGDIVTYNTSDFATSSQGALADSALQPNDNISELNNDAGYITGINSTDVTTALGYTPYNSSNPNDYQENVIESIEVNGTAQTITSKTVNITVPTDTSDLTNGAGYITSASLPTVNNPTITFQKNGSTVESITLNQSNNETINFSIPTTASDINAVPTSREINGHALTNDINLTYSDVGALSDTTTINDLTTTAQQNALNSGATTTNIGQIATNTQAISDETTARENADLGLQQQIDAIVSSSDVFDIVGTYAELQAYDISTVPVNDIIKVLVDSTHNNAATYYRCTESGGVKSWTYIGSEGAYYTKSEADAEFVPQTRTVNNKALSSNITLDATDVGALPSSTTIGSGVLTVQKNGTTIDTFGANDTGNTTVNITVPTDTNDLTNGAGFITNSALSNYATQTDLTNGLATKQDTLIAGTDLEIVNATTPKLPTGYTELEWLQSDGACCIDLGVISYGNDEVEHKFQRPSTLESSVDSWFGSIQNSAAVPRFSIGASSSSGIFAGFNFTKPLAEYDNNIHIISLKKVSSTYYASIDGVTVSYVPSSASTNPSINSYLFARNSSTITYDGTGTRIFYHKQNRYDGTPLLDLVPAKRDSDNALGMYDLVSNAFLGNSGTGTFTGGPEVIYPTTTTINFTNASGYITGITSSDVTTALGYTPYNSSNPAGYTSNVGTVTSVNNTLPDVNGDVTLTIPTVNDGILTITQNGTSKGTFSANQSTNNTIALTDTTYNAFTGADGTNAGSSGLVPAPSATDNDKYLKGDGTWASVSGGSSTDVQINGTSITSGGVANIVTNTAYNASSNKIATMSDIPAAGANTDLSNLTATGEAHFQAPLVSGTNIKTINNTSILGSGDISVGSYSAGTGLSLSGTTFNHSNSVTAGTIGTSSATSGSTISVPYANYDAQGHITSKGTHTHTVTGFLTSSSSEVASSRFDGQWVLNWHWDISTASSSGSTEINISSYLPDSTNSYEVMVYASFSYGSANAGGGIGTTTAPYDHTTSCWKGRVYVNSNARQGHVTVILPIGTSRKIYTQRSASMGDCHVAFIGYRRIGTNS